MVVVDPATQVAINRDEAIKNKLAEDQSVSRNEWGKVMHLIGMDSTLFNRFMSGDVTGQGVIAYGSHILLEE